MEAKNRMKPEEAGGGKQPWSGKGHNTLNVRGFTAQELKEQIEEGKRRLFADPASSSSLYVHIHEGAVVKRAHIVNSSRHPIELRGKGRTIVFQTYSSRKLVNLVSDGPADEPLLSLRVSDGATCVFKNLSFKARRIIDVIVEDGARFIMSTCKFVVPEVASSTPSSTVSIVARNAYVRLGKNHFDVGTSERREALRRLRGGLTAVSVVNQNSTVEIESEFQGFETAVDVTIEYPDRTGSNGMHMQSLPKSNPILLMPCTDSFGTNDVGTGLRVRMQDGDADLRECTVKLEKTLRPLRCGCSSPCCAICKRVAVVAGSVRSFGELSAAPVADSKRKRGSASVEGEPEGEPEGEGQKPKRQSPDAEESVSRRTAEVPKEKRLTLEREGPGLSTPRLCTRPLPLAPVQPQHAALPAGHAGGAAPTATAAKDPRPPQGSGASSAACGQRWPASEAEQRAAGPRAVRADGKENWAPAPGEAQQRR